MASRHTRLIVVISSFRIVASTFIGVLLESSLVQLFTWNSGELVVLHRGTGEVKGGVKLLAEPDVIMHDPTLARLYVAVGDPGVVHVVDERHLSMLSAPGAIARQVDSFARH